MKPSNQTDLDKMREKHKNFKSSKSEKKLISYLEVIVEYAMYGDSKKEENDLFDYFIEQKIMGDIYKKVQEAQSLTAAFLLEKTSMLIANIRQPEKLTHIMSDQNLQLLICHQFDFQLPEVVDIYVNFLKMIAMRIDESNLNLYFNERYNKFPLLWQAAKFINYPDGLVRNTSKNIILTLSKLAAPSNKQASQSIFLQQTKLKEHFQNYLTYSPFIFTYIVQINTYVKCIEQLNRTYKDKRLSNWLTRIEELDEQATDILLFFDDLVRSCNFLGLTMTKIVMGYCVIPILGCTLQNDKSYIDLGSEFGLYAIYRLFELLPFQYTIFSYLAHTEVLDYKLAGTLEMKKMNWGFLLNSRTDKDFEFQFKEIFQPNYKDNRSKIFRELSQVNNPFAKEFQQFLKNKEPTLIHLAISILYQAQQKDCKIDIKPLIDHLVEGSYLSLETIELIGIILIKAGVDELAPFQVTLENMLKDSKAKFGAVLSKLEQFEDVALYANWCFIQDLMETDLSTKKASVNISSLYKLEVDPTYYNLKVVYKYILLLKVMRQLETRPSTQRPQKGDTIIRISNTPGQKVIRCENPNHHILLTQLGYLCFTEVINNSEKSIIRWVQPYRAVEVWLQDNKDLIIQKHKLSIGNDTFFQIPLESESTQQVLQGIVQDQRLFCEKFYFELVSLKRD